MNSFDSELTELFPTENLANMGSYEHIPNDVLCDIFKQVAPLSSIDADITTTESEIVGASETEIQNHEIFDFIGDSCFKEPPSFPSLLTLDNFDELTENSEIRSSVDCLQGIVPVTEINPTDSESSAVVHDVDNDSENRDSCIHKIVDILATFVNESSNDGVLNFNRDLLDHSLDIDPNLFNEIEFSNETRVNSESIQVTCTSNDTIPKESFPSDKSSNVLFEDILMKTISLSNLETTEESCAVDESYIETVSSVRQLAESLPKPSSQERKQSERLLLPCLTEFCCNECQPNIFFVSKSDFQQHQKSHIALKSKKPTFLCKECNLCFNHRVKYRNHLRVHQKLKCEICLKELLPSSLKSHLAVHDKSRRLMCEYCGLSFVSKIKLHEHVSSHTGEKRYTCEQCGRNFLNHGSYWIHKKWHESPLPYKCDCGLSFRHSSALAIHQRRSMCSKILTDNSTENSSSELSEGPLNSDSLSQKENNSSSSSSECRVDTDFSSPLSQSTETCDSLCSSISSNDKASKNLKIVVSKFPKKEHMCELCNRQFPTTTSLRTHQLKHTETRPFKCDRCLKSFPVKNSLSRHQRSSAACDRELKKRLLQVREPSLSVASKKVLPKFNSEELHCPECNIFFNDFQSLVVHFQNECRSSVAINYQVVLTL